MESATELAPHKGVERLMNYVPPSIIQYTLFMFADSANFSPWNPQLQMVQHMLHEFPLMLKANISPVLINDWPVPCTLSPSVPFSIINAPIRYVVSTSGQFDVRWLPFFEKTATQAPSLKTLLIKWGQWLVPVGWQLQWKGYLICGPLWFALEECLLRAQQGVEEWCMVRHLVINEQFDFLSAKDRRGLFVLLVRTEILWAIIFASANITLGDKKCE